MVKERFRACWEMAAPQYVSPVGPLGRLQFPEQDLMTILVLQTIPKMVPPFNIWKVMGQVDPEERTGCNWKKAEPPWGWFMGRYKVRSACLVTFELDISPQGAWFTLSLDSSLPQPFP